MQKVKSHIHLQPKQVKIIYNEKIVLFVFDCCFCFFLAKILSNTKQVSKKINYQVGNYYSSCN